jgi:hypothetical protein
MEPYLKNRPRLLTLELLLLMAAQILRLLKHVFLKSTKKMCGGRFHSVPHRNFSVVIEIHTRQIRLIDGPELALSLSLSGIKHLTT